MSGSRSFHCKSTQHLDGRLHRCCLLNPGEDQPHEGLHQASGLRWGDPPVSLVIHDEATTEKIRDALAPRPDAAGQPAGLTAGDPQPVLGAKDSDHDWLLYGAMAPLYICRRCDLQKYEGAPEYGGLAYFKERTWDEEPELFATIPRCVTSAWRVALNIEPEKGGV